MKKERKRACDRGRKGGSVDSEIYSSYDVWGTVGERRGRGRTNHQTETTVTMV